jgi:hypothetical protein
MEVDTRFWFAVAAGACLLILLFVPRQTIRRWLVGRPNFRLSQLQSLLLDPNFVKIEDMLKGARERMPNTPWEIYSQLRGAHESVIYTKWREGKKICEVLDVNVPGTSGLVLEFENSRVIRFLRVAGRIITKPQFSAEESDSIATLLVRVRNYIEPEKDGHA